MLGGLGKKNATMQSDFALDAERAGATPAEAIYRGCLLRFRPIMMTTMAALLGTLPIALGIGAGAAAPRPLGPAGGGGPLAPRPPSPLPPPPVPPPRGPARSAACARRAGGRPAATSRALPLRDDEPPERQV